MPKYPHNSALSVAGSHIEPNLENQLASIATLVVLRRLSCLRFHTSRTSNRRVYDDCMATWEDGPEYAPIERPSHFQNPDAPPLTAAPQRAHVAASAPESRPGFDHPSTPVRPLASLIPMVRDEPRDPQKPFAVVSSTMTSDSAWGAVHWAAPTGRPVGPTVGWSPAVVTSHPRPDQPIAVGTAFGQKPGQFPAPGTPGWFGPPPHQPQPQQETPVAAKAVLDAATPGLCMCLIIGGLVYVLAPIMLCIGVGLAGRVKVAAEEVRRAHVFALVVLAVLGVLGALIVGTDFTAWWRFVGQWGLLICWVLLVTTLVTIHRRLKLQGPKPPTDRSRWR